MKKLILVLALFTTVIHTMDDFLAFPLSTTAIHMDGDDDNDEGTPFQLNIPKMQQQVNELITALHHIHTQYSTPVHLPDQLIARRLRLTEQVVQLDNLEVDFSSGNTQNNLNQRQTHKLRSSILQARNTVTSIKILSYLSTMRTSNPSKNNEASAKRIHLDSSND